ncbi:transmembrane protein [Klebsiella oxytoca]|nr:transmembrane protein [Klebsiella oxytoca]
MSSLDIKTDLSAQTSASGSKETLEDYTLRYAPLSFRRWGPGVVAVTALGGIAYLADFSIGASIGMAWGTTNAIYAILLAALVIFLTGIPLAITAARYNIDLDLITRSAGFGYFGSVITSIIFAGFTFIFFALEGSIMAQGLLVGLGIPLWMGYLIATLMVFAAGGLRHEGADSPSGLDDAAVAGPDGGSGGLAYRQRPGSGGWVYELRR